MRTLLSWAACVSLIMLASCSALVSGDGQIRCDISASDPCPGNMSCTSVMGRGVCVENGNCATTDRDGDGVPRCGVDSEILDCNDADPLVHPGAPEQCNGVDDNCNDSILDEQEDGDGDGFTRCGNADGPPDCDDQDPDRHPGAMEVCDGIDNDCDGTADEPPADSACGPGQFCASGGRGCIQLDCTTLGCPAGNNCDTSLRPPTCVSDVCMPTACPAGMRFDAASCACAELAGPGEACSAAADCASGVCADSAALRMPGSPAPQICVQACCSDANCPGADQVCWDGGFGARSCLPASLVAGTPAVGMGAPTASCGSGAECGSGVCTENVGLCAATCSNDANCGDGLTCAPVPVTMSPLPERSELACTGSGLGRGGEFCLIGAGCADACSSRNDCAAQVCFDVGGLGFCSNACGTPSDCPNSGTKCASRDASGSGVGWTTVCLPKEQQGASFPQLGQGASCSDDSDCREERCIRGQCAEPCCAAGQCVGGSVCAPVTRSGHWEMRCVTAAS